MNTPSPCRSLSTPLPSAVSSAVPSAVPAASRTSVLALACAFASAASLFTAAPALADPFETLDALSRDEFESLAENLAAATHYKSLSPGEPLGLLGFDVGIELSSTSIDDSSLFDRASDGDFGYGSVLVPRLHAHKGLPFGLDIGASIGQVPEADLSLIGVELRYSIVEGGVATPSVGLRGSYSRAIDPESIDVDSAALELTISKGLLMLTPYAGAGLVRSDVEAIDVERLGEESVDQSKLFVGLNVNLATLNVLAELDRTGGHTSVSAKVGLRF